MNDHQQVAAFILSKIRQAPMVGDESEAVSSAKQWLMAIQQGQFEIKAVQQALEEATPKEPLDVKPPGNSEDKDEPVHE